MIVIFFYFCGLRLFYYYYISIVLVVDLERGFGGFGFLCVWGNLFVVCDYVLFGILIGCCCCILFIMRGNLICDCKLFGGWFLFFGFWFCFFKGIFLFLICRYEIFIDEVKLKDLSVLFLKEFMVLLIFYFVVGVFMKYCKCVFYVCFCILLKYDI